MSKITKMFMIKVVEMGRKGVNVVNGEETNAVLIQEKMYKLQVIHL